MTFPDLEADSGDHEKPGKSRASRKTVAGAVLGGLLAGSTGSAVLPIIIPTLYRPDPARGSELRHLEEEVAKLEHKVERLEQKADLFLVRGPSEVRADLAEIKAKLEAIMRDLARGDHSH